MKKFEKKEYIIDSKEIFKTEAPENISRVEVIDVQTIKININKEKDNG